jgi:imidazolonepropionase-like amidohydrolase
LGVYTWPWAFLWQQHDLYGVASWIDWNPRADEKVWTFEAKVGSQKGRTLMPGLTDAHVHVCAVEGNIAEQHLIALKGNPLKDLRVFQNADALHLIMKGGHLYKRAL